MFGNWVIDLDAIVAQNPSLPDHFLRAIGTDRAGQTVWLHITDRDYVSQSWSKTIQDRYAIVESDGPSVTIALSSVDDVKNGSDRRATLRLRDGKLLISTRHDPTLYIFKRSLSDGG